MEFPARGYVLATQDRPDPRAIRAVRSRLVEGLGGLVFLLLCGAGAFALLLCAP